MSVPAAIGPGLLSKVPIPRLQHRRTEPPRKSSITRLNRVTRACLSCRTRKIRCSGAKPTCTTCEENATPCVYVSSRKDRLKTATERNQEMMDLLRDLRGHVSEGGRSRIDHLLASVVVDIADAADTVHKSAERHDEAEAEHGEGEGNTSAEVASPADADVDMMDDGPNQDAWSQATSNPHTKVASGDTSPSRSPGHGSQRPTSSRHGQKLSPSTVHTSLDDAVVDTDPNVASFELPSFDDAERLFKCYMENCHNSFPFLAKIAFTRSFYDYYTASDRSHTCKPSEQWQAQLNLVFAIGAVYSHLTSAPWRGNERDHLAYHSRAWALGMSDSAYFSRPSLAHMQVTGLLSFYYLCTGRIKSAWILSGMAIRLGSLLGLDNGSRDRKSGAAREEVLSRIWWAHFSLERLVATMTGYPSTTVDKIDPVPLPLALSSEDIDESVIEAYFGSNSAMAGRLTAIRVSIVTPRTEDRSHREDYSSQAAHLEPANSGSYLKKIVQLGEITQHAVSMYAASPLSQTWQIVEEAIVRLTNELESWTNSLPDGFNFLKFGTFVQHQYARERNTLDLLYHGTIILITRPCLCRLDRRSDIRTTAPNEFNQRSALTCVESAKAVARLLPESSRSELALLYQLGPWWNMVQIVIQSLVILLLEVSCEAVQLPHDRRETIVLLKELVRWLRAMRVTSDMANHAYLLVMDLLKALVVVAKMDITDLLQEHDQAIAAAEAAAGPRHFSTLEVPNVLASPTFQIPAQDIFRKASSDSPHLSAPRPFETNESPPAYHDLSIDSLSTSGLAFPGLFFTIYDEENPFYGFGAKDHVVGGLDAESQRLPR